VIARLIVGVAAFGAVAVAATSVAAATSQWGKIGEVGVGMLQDAVYQQHGYGSSGQPQFVTSYRERGGQVDVLFKHGRVTNVSCSEANAGGRGCPAGFALPDGVALNMPVPFRTPWRGYTRYVPPDAQFDFYYWRKAVRVGGRLLHVYLMTERGKIVSIGEGTQ
jgi:hypothetical protein